MDEITALAKRPAASFSNPARSTAGSGGFFDYGPLGAVLSAT